MNQFFLILFLGFMLLNNTIDGHAQTVEICNNGIDDDGDGLTDCADSNCYNSTICYPSFNCSNAAYLFQNSPTDAYMVNLESGTYTLVKDNLISNDAINGIGYNVTDGYFWGSRSLDGYIARIDANFNVLSYYIAGLPSDNFYVGDVNSNGVLYLGKGNNILYKVDINPSSPSYLTYLGALTLNATLNNHDMVFNSNDNFIYSVQKNTNKLIKINPTTGAVALYGPIPALAGNSDTYGAIYMSSDGTMYVSNNTTGVIVYVSQVQNITNNNNIQSGVFAYGPASSTNDGGRCPTAVVLQEICGNGIDDDGDGLSDCDDPLCGGGTLSLVRATCADDFLTYDTQFNTNGTLTSTSAGTISGTQVINVPAGVDITVTATYNDCPTQIDVASPEGCIPPTPVTSGGDGGLESNGSMAVQIAERTFRQIQNSPKSTHAVSIPIHYQRQQVLRSDDIFLDNLVPDISLGNGTTAPLVTSPIDLLGITNAIDILAVDYYNSDQQAIAAVLATQTQQHIYDHTKAICDRLHGAILHNINLVPIESYSIAQMTIEHPNQSREYALTFSVWRDEQGNWNLENYWAVEDYPEHPNYYNFQVWTQSPEYTKQLAEAILDNLKQYGELNHSDTQAQLPSVFVKKGDYQNGQLVLTIQNNSKASQINFSGTTTLSETDTERKLWTQTATIDPMSKTQLIRVNTDQLFDVGCTMTNNYDGRSDVLYLADGAWGLDYEPSKTTIQQFEVQNTQPVVDSDDQFRVQRNVSINAQTNNYLSVFRFLRPAGQNIDLSRFNAISFAASGNDTLSITLVKASITEFEQQARMQLVLKGDNSIYTIPFSHFMSGNSNDWTAEDLKALVFTIKSANNNAKQVDLQLSQITFKNIETPVAETLRTDSAVAIPNPFNNITNITYYQNSTSNATLYLFDSMGKLIVQQQNKHLQGYNSFVIERKSLPYSGIYFYVIGIENSQNTYTGKIVAW